MTLQVGVHGAFSEVEIDAAHPGATRLWKFLDEMVDISDAEAKEDDGRERIQQV